MEFNSSLPIYLQVVTEIKRELVTGQLKPGQKMPSVRELGLKYTINPNTASRVYGQLESEGVCYTKRGMGTFVTEERETIGRLKDEMAQELVRGFLDGMEKLGIDRENAIAKLRELSE